MLGERTSVVILGTRGSSPVAGEAYRHYGHGTTCFLLRAASENVIIDAGTGLRQAEEFLAAEDDRATMLLTHAHMDHLLGFPMWDRLFQPNFQLDILGKTREGLSAEQQLERMMSPPLWPVRPRDLPAGLRFAELKDRQKIGALTVFTLEGCHPNGVSLLRFEEEGCSVVVMTDCTVDGAGRQRYLDFARDCDLLLIDGQYSPAEWEGHSGYGHNTWRQAATFGCDCGAHRIRIIHHDPTHTDKVLTLAQAELDGLHPDCSFGCAGEEIKL